MKKAIFAIFVAALICLCACEDESIGIIGGADGPTTVTVADMQNKR